MFLHADIQDSDQTGRMSLRWAHMPFCWFCHVAAHPVFYPYNLVKDDFMQRTVHENLRNAIISNTNQIYRRKKRDTFSASSV